MKFNFNKIITIAILLIGIIFILDFIFLLSISAVINFGILFTAIVGTSLIIYSIERFKKNHEYLIKNKLIRKVILFGFIIFFFSFVIIESLIFFSPKEDQNVDVDYLIILGAGLKGDTMTLTFKNRVDKGIELLKENPTLKVVVTGGQGGGETVSEGYAMQKHLLENGINYDRIIKEDKSTSTMENFKFSKALLQSKYPKDVYKIMIVTSDFHMFRAKMLAERNGFIVYGTLSKTWVWVLPNSAVREYFAVIKSFFLDK